MAITLHDINTQPLPQAEALLDGLYEHSPWIAREALAQRPFASLSALKYVMTQVLDKAGKDAQLSLIRGHPELAGKAMVSNTLTTESNTEQSKAGLTQCTPAEFAKIQKLNADYNNKFGWPFILAVRGTRGTGLSKQQIIATFERRLAGHPDFELQECLRNIHRVVEIRLNDKFEAEPTLGNELWDWHESLAQYSDAGFKENGQLTVTYLTPAHLACAAFITQKMNECGFDEVYSDAVGNVVGRYHGHKPSQYVLTGSHYDTVRNAGKYDGRLGVFLPILCVRELHKTGKRLPIGIEVVAFAEEEGQRYKATFLGSGALLGQFDNKWLDQVDAEGITMRDAMKAAGLNINEIPAIKRDPKNYLGFVEVHIEQGPVLNALNLPLGVVTSINGSVRYLVEITGMASHAGTTPMNARKDASLAAAEIALYMEKRALQDGDSVATVGILNVPSGSTNVVPGKCVFTMDLRAPSDTQRDSMVADILAQLSAICERRGLSYTLEQTMKAAAAPSSQTMQLRWEAAVKAQGLPVFKMPSGAGHDAMKLHEIMPQAMLFVRGQHSGISHNPLESTSNSDMQIALEAFQNFIHAAS